MIKRAIFLGLQAGSNVTKETAWNVILESSALCAYSTRVPGLAWSVPARGLEHSKHGGSDASSGNEIDDHIW